MKLKAIVFCTTMIILGTINSYGQSQVLVERTKEELQGSILDQFQYILDKSYNYSSDNVPFEVIKNRYVLAFKIHLSDTLAVLKQQINLHNKIVDELNTQIDASKAQIKQLETTNSKLSTQTSSIDIIGVRIDKTYFKTIIAVLIVLLTLIIILLSNKLRKANDMVNQAKDEADEAQKEQERFRRTSMEREQKLKRELLNLSKESATTLSAQSASSAVSLKDTNTTKKSTTSKKTPKK